MPPASGAASRRVVQPPAPGPTGWSRACARPMTLPSRRIPRRARRPRAELAGEGDVDRRRADGDAGAGEAGDVEPGVGAREAVVRRLGEVDASGGPPAEAEARREDVEDRDVEAVEPRLDDRARCPSGRRAGRPCGQHERRRRQLPAAADLADLGRAGEAEGDVADLALRGGADQVGRERGIDRDPERDAAAPLGEELGGAVAAAIVDADPGAGEEEDCRWRARRAGRRRRFAARR